MSETPLNPSEADARTPRLRVIGEPSLLHSPLIGFFASSSCPSDLVLPTLDLVMDWPSPRLPIISGFQSPLERAALEILICTRTPAVGALPAAVNTSRLPRSWQRALAGGRLALMWEEKTAGKRATEKAAESRNRLILELAHGLIVVSGGTASRTYRVARTAAACGHSLLCHAHPRERDLVLLGAEPCAGAGEWEAQLSAISRCATHFRGQVTDRTAYAK